MSVLPRAVRRWALAEARHLLSSRRVLPRDLGVVSAAPARDPSRVRFGMTPATGQRYRLYCRADAALRPLRLDQFVVVRFFQLANRVRQLFVLLDRSGDAA